MKLPRLRFTVRSLMLLVAVVATLIAMPPKGIEWGIRAKEEVRARRAVVEHLSEAVTYYTKQMDRIGRLIARSSREPQKDPRHEEWVKSVANYQAMVDRLQQRTLP
jgi:hypothetical protein